MDAAKRWAQRQGGRGIPAEILAKAPRSPWGFTPADFAAPATPEATPSRQAALELLGEGGAVLDVGCGGGTAAFALVPPAVRLVGADRQPDMLELFAATAAERGVPASTVCGDWPAAAPEVGVVDVVVCHHVLHNVVDLPPFLRALSAAAGRGVVVEMMAEHPMAWLDPLWERFHALHRPPPATVEDAVAVLGELGVTPSVTRWPRGPRHRQDPAWVTQRLCLPADRVEEVAAAMQGLPRPAQTATLTWTT